MCANKIIEINMKIPLELPTTVPNRIYMITPKIVSKEGVNTPPKVPNFFSLDMY
jgi:hypothetical protein